MLSRFTEILAVTIVSHSKFYSLNFSSSISWSYPHRLPKFLFHDISWKSAGIAGHRFRGYSTDADMAPPKAWFKLLNPESDWDKVSLEEIEDVTDLKKAIKKESPVLLKDYDASQLTLSATVKIDDAGQAVKLDARKGLASTLKDFSVEVPDERDIDSVQKSFAENVWLFVGAPAGPGKSFKLTLFIMLTFAVPYRLFIILPLLRYISSKEESRRAM